ncbi:MAG: EamA family transporter [Clostridiales bacterium]|nr:EamA family transporter [Clostridiales bacterium]
MKENKRRPLLAIFAVNFIWGFDFVAIDYMMDYVTPIVFTMSRLVIGCGLLLILSFVKNKGVHIKKEDLLRVLICGGLGMGIYFSIENWGVGLTSASFSSLIMATLPIFGMIADRLFFGNKITPVKVVCVIFSVLGVYLLVSGEPLGMNLKGLFVMILAAVIWTVYMVMVKPLYEKYDLLTLLTGLFIAGLIVETPILLLSNPTGLEITGIGIIITVATTLVCFVLGELAYTYALGKLSVTVVASFENVLPIVACVLSFIIFGTMLTGMQIIGGLIIMTAVTTIAFKG